MIWNFPKLLFTVAPKTYHRRKCHTIFGIHKLIDHDKPDRYRISTIQQDNHQMAVEAIKRHYIPDHLLVQSRNMDLSDDRAIDQYLFRVLRQGNSLCAKTENGTVAGVSVNFASSRFDPNNLRHFAFHRQNPNTKDFLNFIATLQEIPNLWQMYRQTKIFEAELSNESVRTERLCGACGIKMLAVTPEHRRQGLGVMLAEKSIELAKDQGYKVVRMDCLNRHDFKIAERCNMKCQLKFPLHKLRDARAPFIDKSSEYHRQARVYVDVCARVDVDGVYARARADELESLVE